MSESAWLDEICGDCGESYRTCICGGVHRAEVRHLRGLLARLEGESLTCPVCAAILHLGDQHGLDSDGQPCWLAAELRTERPCPPS